MKRIITKTRCILEPDDLRGYYGVSQHRGVLVLWDEDLDERILEGIDNMDEFDRIALFAAAEHKGSVDLYWRDHVPAKYTTLDMFCGYDGVIENHVLALANPIYGETQWTA